MTLASTISDHAFPFYPGKIITADFSASPSPRYDIVIGQNIMAEAGTLIRLRLGERCCVIITDSNVDRHYRMRLEAVITAAGHDVLTSVVLPAGEESKNFATLQTLLENILALGIDRQTLIIAFGGGVVGDIGGLAASLLLHGLDLVQMPTTLLAQVDGAIGGKTCINGRTHKNAIGSYYQPRLVISDLALLDSLSARDMRSGYAEIVRYGVMRDAAFFKWCVAHYGQILAGDRDAQIQAISHCCQAKLAILGADGQEADHRLLLDFGHRFGDALERVANHGLLHGEAVAIGMMMSCALSVALGLCPQSDYDAVCAHLAAVGLAVRPSFEAGAIDRLVDLTMQDEKTQKASVSVILCRGIGQVCASHNVDRQFVRQIWESFLCP